MGLPRDVKANSKYCLEPSSSERSLMLSSYFTDGFTSSRNSFPRTRSVTRPRRPEKVVAGVTDGVCTGAVGWKKALRRVARLKVAAVAVKAAAAIRYPTALASTPSFRRYPLKINRSMPIATHAIGSTVKADLTSRSDDLDLATRRRPEG